MELKKVQLIYQKNLVPILIDSLEKYKLIRRLILVFILYLCYDIHKLTTLMYKETGQVDMQWVIYATAYILLCILTLFITFLTTNRGQEVDNEHKKRLTAVDR